MAEDFLWAILGLALVIVELLSGTFYLVMLGIAAFGAAVAAWIGQPFGVQAVVAAVIAAAGCYGVHVYRAKNAKGQMAPLDAGQPASFEAWLDQGAGRARVRYRGAPWDAEIEGTDGGNPAPEPGATVYVIATHGNTLKVSTRRPA
ncbi:MAG TPA: NfeD family protein [Burkholderiales bacterium]|nr:NfeD family protein [Burkholderiales bacterium]